MSKSALGILAMASAVAGFAATAFALAPNRTFTIAAIEPKGGANIEKEPFPSTPLPEGGGYILKKPNDEGRWEVQAYLWSATQIVVNQGDEVTLEFIGINGAAHPTTIEGYDKSFTLKRGAIETVSFNADKPGVFKIICTTHRPSMTSELVVLPK